MNLNPFRASISRPARSPQGSSPPIAARLSPGPRVLFAAAAASLIAVLAIIGASTDVGQLTFHGPDLALWSAQSPVVQAHVGAALFALATGAGILLRRKGDRLHKILGWSWVVMMTATAATSLFILELNHGSFSLIHGLSAYTLVALPLGVMAARSGNIRAHRSTMMSMFTGALIIAGLFTFLPGRLMWDLFVS
jgi:uncharacterized membrane protein